LVVHIVSIFFFFVRLSSSFASPSAIRWLELGPWSSFNYNRLGQKSIEWGMWLCRVIVLVVYAIHYTQILDAIFTNLFSCCFGSSSS
jgi:hypothetical protein